MSGFFNEFASTHNQNIGVPVPFWLDQVLPIWEKEIEVPKVPISTVVEAMVTVLGRVLGHEIHLSMLACTFKCNEWKEDTRMSYSFNELASTHNPVVNMSTLSAHQLILWQHCQRITNHGSSSL